LNTTELNTAEIETEQNRTQENSTSTEQEQNTTEHLEQREHNQTCEVLRGSDQATDLLREREAYLLGREAVREQRDLQRPTEGTARNRRFFTEEGKKSAVSPNRKP
jgi:hypothetical protein